MFEDLFSSADVQRRKSNRRLGAIGTGLGVLAFLGGGALAVDFIMTNPPDLTIAQEVFPMLTRSTEFTSSVGLMLGGAGIGFPSATLYLLNRE